MSQCQYGDAVKWSSYIPLYEHKYKIQIPIQIQNSCGSRATSKYAHQINSCHKFRSWREKSQCQYGDVVTGGSYTP